MRRDPGVTGRSGSGEDAAPAVPQRAVIEDVTPQIENGRFPIKRTLGEEVVVEAAIHADGHDLLAAALCFRDAAEPAWREVAMTAGANDRWSARFTVASLGTWEYAIEAWVDAYGTWSRDLRRRVAAGQDVTAELPEGARLVEEAIAEAPRDLPAEKAEHLHLAAWVAELRDARRPVAERVLAATDPERARRLAAYTPRPKSAAASAPLRVSVDRERARFSAWYEMFPRSAADLPGRHGTFADAERRLPYVAAMGFDVLYLPPIHPIGRTNRKGKNGTLGAGPGDPGSPWAIGAEEGGHTAIHPALGTFDDFRRFRGRAAELGLEIALDLAFQCSPDHPWVREHPEWFRRRLDGAIRHAENPPKRYEDIYPLDFECPEWRSLWQALREIVRFWTGEGIRIFRVDNPHTKPYAFWEWLIADVRREHPETIFLSEAFTRPHVMQRLAKAGFQQSYTYFAWRNTSREIREYFTELTRSELGEYFRPNLWPNTPDILPEYLQAGGRAAFTIRLVLSATLGASYGVYGPAFELCMSEALAPGREEYLDSEKYEIRHWDLERPESLRHVIARLNRLRRENPALQTDRGLEFLEVSNDRILAFVKTADAPADVILVIVNLDPHHVQSAWVEIPLERLGLEPSRPFQVHDLLGGGRYLWTGSRNFVELDPQGVPAHVSRIRRRVRTERDFDYYL